MRVNTTTCLLAVAALFLVTSAAARAAEPAAGAFERFITRSGDKLMDGTKEFADVKPERSGQTFSNLPRDIIKVGGRTRVEYRGTVPAGNRCFKILWTGPAELDRVELCHPGTP